jgi:hypothetical protein
MKMLDYKGYTISLEKQHNGSFLAYIYNEYDYVYKMVYYFYKQSEIKSMLKEIINNKDFQY